MGWSEIQRYSFKVRPTTPCASRAVGARRCSELEWCSAVRVRSVACGPALQVPESWEEVPVSIADLGGTEIDLR